MDDSARDKQNKVDKEAFAKANGLSASDFAFLRQAKVEANLTEIGVIAAMWSEHCSYRSSKPFLSTLFSQGKQVIEGPGENAGIIDIGDGQAAVFKMESHNHPSFLDPYQGAATGVGGIMRDIFTMGARPIAFLNALRFGALDHKKTHYFLREVVAGIGGYGNCVGVPTIGGELDFDKSYNGNILVNAMCVGIVEQKKIFRSRCEADNLLIYVGAPTGRDGICGAVMASAIFQGDEANRTSVQIGDPFMQKLLLEACLEMMEIDGVIGVQDMGAAGLTSSSVEMAHKSGLGVELNLDDVPCRENDMNAYEMMLSESQERMVLAIRPQALKKIEAICQKWDIHCALIGKADKSQRLKIYHNGDKQADIAIELLVNDAPPINREIKHESVTHARPKPQPLATKKPPLAIGDALNRLLNTAEACSREWVWRQYDRNVMGDSLPITYGDAALVRIHNSRKALALTCEVTPRYCQASAYQGAKQAMAEAFRNIISVGATPLAATDCLNFASPEDPYIMGQFAQAINGLSEAARALNMPIISGNVSFYNETDGKAIIPTPTIGALGLINDYHRAISFILPNQKTQLLLLGDSPSDLGGMTLYQKYILKDERIIAPPLVELEKEAHYGLFLRDCILDGRVKAAHDIGSGGLAIALFEMARASNQSIDLSQNISPPSDNSLRDNGFDRTAFFFSESQARYLIACDESDLDSLYQNARQVDIPLLWLGETIIYDKASPFDEACAPQAFLDLGDGQIELNMLDKNYREFLPRFMER